MVVTSAAMRARRPVLPALTAVLAGALVAGAATVLSQPPPQSGADRLRVGVSSEQSPSDEPVVTETSASNTTPTGAPTSPGAPTTTTPAPPPASSSTPVEPPAPPPTTTAPPAAAPDTSLQDQVVTLTNAARQEAGCAPLGVDANLTAAAQGHAQDMAARDYFDHTTPNGVTFDQRIRAAGYSKPGAENIARGAATAESVMDLWLNSPGHRANILNCDLTAIGVGLDQDGFYWVQNFGF